MDLIRLRRGLSFALAMGVCAVLLAGCSRARMGYDWIPALTVWQLERYLALDREQAQETRRDLGAVLDWHRRAELPGYAAYLEQTARRLEGVPTVDAAVFQDWRERVHGAWLALVPQLGPPLAGLALSLRESQIDRLERRLAERTEELHAEYLPPDSKRQIEGRVERWLDRAEFFFGEVSDGQRQALQRLAGQMPAYERLWLQERELRVQTLLALLRRIAREQPSPAAASRWCEDYLAGLWQSADPARQARIDEASRHADSISLVMINQASHDQRARLLQKLRGYVSDFALLAAR